MCIRFAVLLASLDPFPSANASPEEEEEAASHHTHHRHRQQPAAAASHTTQSNTGRRKAQYVRDSQQFSRHVGSILVTCSHIIRAVIMGFSTTNMSPLTGLLQSSASMSSPKTAVTMHTTGSAAAVSLLSTNISILDDYQEADGGVLSQPLFTDPLQEMNLAGSIRDVSDLFEAIESLNQAPVLNDGGSSAVITASSSGAATSFSPFSLFGMKRKSTSAVDIAKNADLVQQVCCFHFFVVFCACFKCFCCAASTSRRHFCPIPACIGCV